MTYLVLNHAQRQATVRFLAALRDAEYAFAVARYEDIGSALAGIDPHELAALITAFTAAEPQPNPPERSRTSSIPRGSDGLSPIGRPSAAVEPDYHRESDYPKVVHALDPWSRKAG